MSDLRLTLSKLQLRGRDQPVAEIAFRPGLNVIVGTSDTGKTFILQAIDYAFAASKPLRRIPESLRYESVLLEINPHVGSPFTLRRATAGGDINVEEFAEGRANPPTSEFSLSKVHNADPERSLSAYMLQRIGLGGRNVRTHKNGKTSALSFRDICHLTLISETEIIVERSPVSSGQYTKTTRDRSVFGYFLTGRDDSAIVRAKAPNDDTNSREAERALLTQLISENLEKLAPDARDLESLRTRALKIESAIDSQSRVLIASKEQIGVAERQRSALIKDRIHAESRINFIRQQLKRFRLLQDYYESDHRRLSAVLEASQVFHDLPEGNCPICRRPFMASDSQSDASHDPAFEEACRQELAKIDLLSNGLDSAIADSVNEEAELRSTLARTETAFAAIDASLTQLLAPQTQNAHAELRSLMEQRSLVLRAEASLAQVESLQLRLQALPAKRPKTADDSSYDAAVTTSTATDFCKVVADVLEEWKYPGLQSVSFDTAKMDLVINGQDRSNKGKGHRAITYAAFVIALMRYCRKKKIPHPGYVVLDSPLNPFKGVESTNDGEQISDEVKIAFYESLANDKSGDQVIVIENEHGPAESVRDRVQYYRFTKDPAVGRYGLFPTS